jgi:hypothetical protein
MLGGSGEIRTRDQRIKSPLLYRLSYRPSKKEIIARSLYLPLGFRGAGLRAFCLKAFYELTRLATGGFLEK